MKSSLNRGMRNLWACLALLSGSSLFASDLTLFETPRDRDHSVLSAIKEAGKEVDVEVYELTDPDVERALIQARKSGRAVRVILNRHFAGDRDPNRQAWDELQAGGVNLRLSPPYFTYTHEKSIIIDAGDPSEKVLIMTLNLGPGYLGKPDKLGLSLNFGVIDRSAQDVSVIKHIFEADWAEKKFDDGVLAADRRLIASPINARSRLVGQIEKAKKSFHFFAQELFDPQIVGALVAAAARGVEVKGLVPSNFQENRSSGDKIKAAGGDVRFLDKPVYEHAKAAIADGSLVYIGSINYSANSMDRNRELGILTDQADIARSMEGEFARYWKEAQRW